MSHCPSDGRPPPGPPAGSESLLPVVVGGYLNPSLIGEVDSGQDLVVHELRVYDSVLADEDAMALYAELFRRWIVP